MRLSETLGYAMAGTYYDTITCAVVPIKFERELAGNIRYTRVMETDCAAGRYLLMPCINQAKVFVEFIERQGDELVNDMHARGVFIKSAEMPLTIEMPNSSRDYAEHEWMPIIIKCSSVIGMAELDWSLGEYTNARVAGIMFKWCRENGVQVDRDMDMYDPDSFEYIPLVYE